MVVDVFQLHIARAGSADNALKPARLSDNPDRSLPVGYELNDRCGQSGVNDPPYDAIRRYDRGIIEQPVPAAFIYGHRLPGSRCIPTDHACNNALCISQEIQIQQTPETSSLSDGLAVLFHLHAQPGELSLKTFVFASRVQKSKIIVPDSADPIESQVEQFFDWSQAIQNERAHDAGFTSSTSRQSHHQGVSE